MKITIEVSDHCWYCHEDLDMTKGVFIIDPSRKGSIFHYYCWSDYIGKFRGGIN